MKSTFEAIKILDLTRYFPGAYATQIYADLGAEVIKVEEVTNGDLCRLDPPKMQGFSYYFTALNRNKKSLALNLKSEQGQQIFKRLAKEADVIIENFRPGVTKRLNIDYPAIKKLNPKIIYCSLSGYGQENPNSLKASHDINFLALSGFLALNKDTGSQLPPVFVADMAGSMFAAMGISLALLDRRTTGVGQYLDVALFNSFQSWLSLIFSRFHFQGNQIKPESFEFTGDAICYNLYKTKDNRFMSIGMVEPKFWQEFCERTGAEDLIPKQFVLRQNDPEAWEKICNIVASKTQQEWIEWLQDKDVCMSPVKNLEEAIQDNLVANQGIIDYVNFPEIGKTLQIGFPLKLSGILTTLQETTSPPALGQHTVEILQQIGFNEHDIKALIGSGIVGEV